MRIVLGSASSRRQKILKDLGYDFTVLAADIDEKAIRHDDFRQLPLLVAQAKSDAVQKMLEGKEPAILITCDTVVVHDGKLYEKPKDETEARDMLMSYSTKPAEVICGVIVTNTATGKTASGLDSAKVYFLKIPHEAIENIINFAPVFEWAGAFHPDHATVKPYIAHIEGEIGTVMGLPSALTKKLIVEVS